MNKITLDENVKLWFNSQYNMICSDPRKIKGTWRYLADLYLFNTNRPLKFNSVDGALTLSKCPSLSSTVTLEINNKIYPLGSAFRYVTRREQVLTYKLDWSANPASNKQRTITSQNYLLTFPVNEKLYVKVNNLIFPVMPNN